MFFSFLGFLYSLVVLFFHNRNDKGNGGGNNCKTKTTSGGGGQAFGCNKKNYFPSNLSGNTCSGVETKKDTNYPNGCGCKPNSDAPCTYNRADADINAQCFVCSAQDLVDINTGVQSSTCVACSNCLSVCDTCITDDQLDVNGMITCIGNNNCRESCSIECADQEFPIAGSIFGI